MCVVSMVTDHYTDKWQDRIPWTTTGQGSGGLLPNQLTPGIGNAGNGYQELLQRAAQQQADSKIPAISKEEIKEFRELLERAREYDKRNNEPSCELQEKKEKLLGIVKLLGVEIDFL